MILSVIASRHVEVCCRWVLSPNIRCGFRSWDGVIDGVNVLNVV